MPVHEHADDRNWPAAEIAPVRRKRVLVNQRRTADIRSAGLTTHRLKCRTRTRQACDFGRSLGMCEGIPCLRLQARQSGGVRAELPAYRPRL